MSDTPISVKKTIYSDFHKDFFLNPITGDLARHTNEESVKESIKNLLLTDKGERVFQPELGSNIRSMLFDNIDSASVRNLQEIIKETLNNYEPRAEILGIDVDSSFDSNEIEVTIVFSIINREEPITITTVLTRTN